MRLPRDRGAWLALVVLALAIVVLAAVYGVERAGAAPYRQCGIASWYGTESGRVTANGERFPGREATAAHRTLPFGTHVRVTDLRTGRSIVVRINDRGPYVRGRIIDLSPAARRALGGGGLWRVCLEKMRTNGHGGGIEEVEYTFHLAPIAERG